MSNNDMKQKVSDIVHRLHGRTFLDGDTPNMDYPQEAIEQLLSLLTEAETRGRIDENKRWLTVLAPSMDENVACNSDFHERIAELKEQS